MDPGSLMGMAWGFARSKMLLEGCKMNLFGLLEAEGPLSTLEIKQRLGWAADVGSRDYLDGLVALGVLQRQDDTTKQTQTYSNASCASDFFVPGKPGTFHGLMVMMNDRLYGIWGNLGDALRTGDRQSEGKGDDSADFFETANARGPDFVKDFAMAMEALSDGTNAVFAEKFDFSKYKSMADLGGSLGSLAKQVAMHNGHMMCHTYDLLELENIANEYIQKTSVADRVKVGTLDIFSNAPFPNVDVICMARVLHDWGLPKRKLLMKKAFDALPSGGAFVALDSCLDSDRKGPVDAFLMSVNMLLEVGKENASEYTFDEFQSWAAEIGYKRCELMPVMATVQACIAYKE